MFQWDVAIATLGEAGHEEVVEGHAAGACAGENVVDPIVGQRANGEAHREIHAVALFDAASSAHVAGPTGGGEQALSHGGAAAEEAEESSIAVFGELNGTMNGIFRIEKAHEPFA